MRKKKKQKAIKKPDNIRFIYYIVIFWRWGCGTQLLRISGSLVLLSVSVLIRRAPTVFHTPSALDIILITLVFICFLFFLRLINNLPTFRKTSLIEISTATNPAQAGNRFKLTKRTKIDCSQFIND